MDYSTEQYRHDEINLKRLVRRLEKSVFEQEWNGTSEHVWIKAQGTLQVNILLEVRNRRTQKFEIENQTRKEVTKECGFV